MSQTRTAVQNQVMEWSYLSAKAYGDAFNEVELDVMFDGPGGQWRVPAFWSGENEWRVRFAPPSPGAYRYKTICSDTANAELHGREGELEAAVHEGTNPLMAHGRLRVSADRRHLEHTDGTPFFWLGDTWWMSLCRRLDWPAGFQLLTADRASKGFSVIQIVAGLYPDMPAFDPRGANEAGFPWEKDYARINPAYFDMADLRIAWLVRSGLVPCIVGCWGYFLPWMGIPKMKQHWRNLVARWGAYPVIWCLAGEGTMPYYLSTTKEKDAAIQKRGWTEVGVYLRQIDPYGHPLTIHPSNSARNTVEDASILDIDMLQTGHSDRASLPNTVKLVAAGCTAQPPLPVINSEVCYEGIGEACRQEVQRLMFWACMLNGAAGHTYGANGIWQLNSRQQPYGPGPHGMSWGNTPWEEALQLPGSRQLGLAKRLLQRYPWWRFETHPEWIDPHWTAEDYSGPYAAGIPHLVRIFYLPTFPWGRVVLRELEPDTPYHAYLFNPADGAEHRMGMVAGDAAGQWVMQEGFAKIPRLALPLYQDWVLVLETAKARTSEGTG